MTPAETQAAPTAFALRASLLFAAMKALLITASDDPDRPHLAGVFFESTGKTLWMVSSDGHRLGVWEHRLDTPGPRGNWFVPRTFIEWIVMTISQLRFLERRGFLGPDDDNPVGRIMPHGYAPRRASDDAPYDPLVSIDFESLTATTALGSIRFALSSETFPSWRKVIPDWAAVRNHKEVDGVPVPWLDAQYVDDALRCFRHAASVNRGAGARGLRPASQSSSAIAIIPSGGPPRPSIYHTGPVVIRSPGAPWFTYLLMPMKPATNTDLWQPLEESE